MVILGSTVATALIMALSCATDEDTPAIRRQIATQLKITFLRNIIPSVKKVIGYFIDIMQLKCHAPDRVIT
jgi:hypothetical protein